MLLHMDLLLELERVSSAPPRRQWVPYERVLDAAPSLPQLERICRDAAKVGNGPIFWPALILLGEIHLLLPTYLPAGVLGYITRVVAERIYKRKESAVTTEEAADRLGVSTRHVRRLIVQGQLKAVLTESGHWRIDAESVEKWKKSA